MPRPKKNPNYNPEQIMNELLETVSKLYNSNLSIRKIGDELALDWQKVRKLLCTANYRGMIGYDSETADEILDFYKQNKNVAEIMSLTGLSRSSVLSYLPYTKVPYKTAEVSANAERIRVFRERDLAVRELKQDPRRLWETVKLFQDYPFTTSKGQKFKYKVDKNKLLVDKGEVRITKSTVEKAYRERLERNECGAELDEIGSSSAVYLYPIFERLGVLKTDVGSMSEQEE